jgi:DHA3 family macrolide efflux protein-like MFS transporter
MRPAHELEQSPRGERPAAAAVAQPGLLANRDFRLYFVARIVSQLGDQLYVFAISWFVLDLTRSSFHMAALLALHSLAVMAVAPFSGLIADRVSRKKVMAGTDLLQAAVLLALLVLRRGGLLSIGALYGGTVLLGLCSAVFLPAATAIVPGLVGGRRIPEAVAAGQASANFCTILGMLLGGALYRFIGIGGVLLLNAASNLIAAAMVSRLRAGGQAGAAGNAGWAGEAGGATGARRETVRAAGELRRFAAELREGLARVRADRQTFGLLLVNTAFTLAVMPIAMVYIPYLFNVLLGAAPLQAAIPQAATWAGIIAGSTAAARLLRRRAPEKLIAGGLLALAAHTLLMVALLAARGLLGVSWMSAACTLGNAIAGAAGAFFIVPIYAVFHARGAEEFRGRFWGLESSLRTAAMCAGFFAGGILAQRLPLGLLFAGTAGVLLVLLFWVTRIRPAAPPRAAG